MKRSLKIGLCVFVALAFAGCAGPQAVKQYEIGKATAETILYNARIAQNKGLLSADNFAKIKDAYDKLKMAQDAAIDARKAVIAYNTADNQAKAAAAMNSVLTVSAEFLNLAQKLGLQ